MMLVALQALSVAQTEDLVVFPNCIRQKQIPESPCEPAPLGDVAQTGIVPHGAAQLSFLLQPPCGCVLASRSNQVCQLVSSRDLLGF